MDEFISAVKEADAEGGSEGDKTLPLKMDGRVLKFNPPTPGQLVLLTSSMGAGNTGARKMGTMLSIIVNALDEDDRDYIEGRLLAGGKDGLQPDAVKWMVEKVTAHWFRDGDSTSD